jgi:hypothetical protein
MSVKKKSKSSLQDGEQLDKSKSTSSCLHGLSLKGDTKVRVTASGMPNAPEIDLERYF